MNAITNRNNAQMDAYPVSNNAPASANMNMNPMLASDPTVAREVATVQSQMIIAKMYPRDLNAVYRNIEASCSRLTLAQQSTYVFSRGGTEIKGASIRLAEALVKAYGSVKYGFQIIDDNTECSTVRAYAFDMESNTLVERTFPVSHYRSTRNGKTLLTDPRDIYEMVANQSARRVRACILAVIPSDIVDYALDICSKTVADNIKITPDTVNKLLDSFRDFGVTRPQIEDFIQRKVEAITIPQYMRLREIYSSLRDGMGVVENFFKSLDEIQPKNKPKRPEGEITASKPENVPQMPYSSSDEPIADESAEEMPSFDF